MTGISDLDFTEYYAVRDRLFSPKSLKDDSNEIPHKIPFFLCICSILCYLLRLKRVEVAKEETSKIKNIIRGIALLGCLMALFFGSAGTFDWLEAWLFPPKPDDHL